MLFNDFLDNQWECDCIGCSIGQGDIDTPGGMLYETGNYVIHQDPAVPIKGFLVIASKKHIRSISEFTQAEAMELFHLVYKARLVLSKITDIKDITIVQEERSSHLHIWLFPKYEWMENIYGKSLNAIRPIMEYASENLKNKENIEEILIVSNIIKNELQKNINVNGRIENTSKYHTRLSRAVIYESNWVNLYVDKVIFPDGRLINEHHFLHNKDQSICVVIENDKDEILLIESLRYVTGTVEWEIPAGGVELGEDKFEAARRECVEETGYAIGSLEFIHSYNPSNGISDGVVNIFKAKAISTTDIFDKNEVNSYRWVRKEEIKTMIKENKIRCGLTLTALLLTMSSL